MENKTDDQFNQFTGRDCEFIKADGTRCRSWRLLDPAPDGKYYCWWHHPAMADRRRASRLKGGSRGKYSRVVMLDPHADAAELVAYIKSFILDLQGRTANKVDDRVMLSAIGELRACLQFWFEYGAAADIIREVAEREGIK